MKKLACSREECPEPSRWRPVLELRTGPRAGPRRLHLLQLAYCDAHKRESTLESFLSDEGWNKITKTVREAGKERRLDRQSTTLSWERLEKEDLKRLRKKQQHTAAPEVAKGDDELAF